MKNKLKWVGLVCFGVLASVSSWAAYDVELTLVGSKQGEIAGDGAKGAIHVLSFTNSESRPVDAASGQVTGKLRATEYTITKEFDKSSTSLIQALSTNEVFKTFVLRFYRAMPAGAGKEENYFTITLTNAVVTNYNENGSSSGVPTESFSFTFQKIQYTDEITHHTTEMSLNPFSAEMLVSEVQG